MANELMRSLAVFDRAMREIRRLPIILAIVSLVSCAAWETVPEATDGARKAFQAPKKVESKSPASVLEAFRTDPAAEYRLGDGDQIYIDVVGRPELSGQQIVGPDGRVTLPVVGGVSLRELSRDQAADVIRQALTRYYKDVYTTVRVDRYNSNLITVLGRVEKPGPVQFDTPPKLLDILSKAGVFPLLRPEQVITRCAVIRHDKILWIDVRQLLAGDMNLNVPLQRKDVVYIPDAFDTSVFVLGAVAKPGAYRLTPQMSFLDALGQAGGPVVDGDMTNVHVIRPEKGVHHKINLEEVMIPDPKSALALEQGDIIYVPRHGVAKVGYIMRTLNPFAQLWTLGVMTGAM